MNCHIHPHTGLLYDENWLLYCPSCDDMKVIENFGGQPVRSYGVRYHYAPEPRDLYETADFPLVDYDEPVRTVIKRRISRIDAAVLTGQS